MLLVSRLGLLGWLYSWCLGVLALYLAACLLGGSVVNSVGYVVLVNIV